jgi:MFS family permease
MRQRTVWLRSDPLGSHTVLPTREEFRARHARRSVRAGAAGLLALAVGLVLAALGLTYPTWAVFYVLALVFGVAGIAAAAVALRAHAERRAALLGLTVSGAAFLGSLIAPALIG